FFLIALAVHGYEPVSLKYFRIEPDGAVHYLTWKEIAAEESKNAKLLHSGWTSPDFSEAFSNSELTFKKHGETATKVHRHMAENLDDTHFGKEVGLQKWLESKGRVVAMTKAASYLLWRDDFGKIRQYLLDHMDFMVSDSTGIPPEFATKAGFVQETYGKFDVSFLGAKKEYNDEFRKLWKDNPKKDLKFRYGYIDGMGNFHMVITKKPAAKG